MDSDQPRGQKDHQYSSSELLSSAKFVAEAAQSTFRNESENVDKAKVADAAGDLLGAASDYAKLDNEKGFGKYVDKAEDYLKQYSSQSTTPSGRCNTVQSEQDSSTNTDPSKQESGGGGGFGDDIKTAQGFINSSDSSKTESQGDGGHSGAGDYLKMAQGFLGK